MYKIVPLEATSSLRRLIARRDLRILTLSYSCHETFSFVVEKEIPDALGETTFFDKLLQQNVFENVLARTSKSGKRRGEVRP